MLFRSSPSFTRHDRLLRLTVILTGLVGASAHSFFIGRAWYRKFILKLILCIFVWKAHADQTISVSDRNRALTAGLALVVVIEFTDLMIYYANIHNKKLFSQLSSNTTEVIEKVTCSIILFTDIVLASCLVFLLYRRRSGFGKTDSIVKRLITYIVSTSLVTVIVMGLAFISLFAFPGTFLYISLTRLVSQCMSCST